MRISDWSSDVCSSDLGDVLNVESLASEQVGQVFGVDDHRGRGAARHPHGHLAQGLAELALEVAHASLTGVARHDLVKSIVGDVDLLGPKAVALQLSLEQVIAGDGDLLVFGVAVDRDDLEPVEKGPGDRLEDVRGGDEEDV